MAVEGSLDLFQLPEILQIIAQEGKTGILTVQGENDIVAISFLGGEIVAADALNQTIEEGLGEVLLARGLLSTEALAAAAAEQDAAGGRLLDILVAQGLERSALMDALRVQTQGLLQDLLGWSEGEFKFYSGDEVSYEEGFVPISVKDLLLSSLPEEEPAAEEDEAPAPAREAAAPAVETAAPEIYHPPPPATRAPVAPAPPAPVLPAPARAPREEALRPPPGIAAPVVPVERPSRAPDHWRTGLAAVLGLLAAAGILAGALLRPFDLLFPAPIDEGSRALYEASDRQARYAKVDVAARTYGLLEGGLPYDLQQLADLGLLSPGDLEDQHGEPPPAYIPDEDRFRLEPAAGEEGPVFEGTIRGDFLLDRGFLEARDARRIPPLILLD